MVVVEIGNLVKINRKTNYNEYVYRRSYSGKNNPNWRNGYKKVNGYIRVLKRDHHFVGKDGRVLLHRLLYEEYHKCCLLPWGKIDHLDGNIQNNSIENLELKSQSRHIIRHMTKDMTGRNCQICKSNKTLINKKGRPVWFKHEDGFMCQKCRDEKRYDKIRKNIRRLKRHDH